MSSSPGVSLSVRHDALTSVTGMIMIAAIVVLFIAVVFVGSLHLFARRARRRTAARSQLRGFVFNPDADDAVVVTTPRKGGLDAAIVGSLPVLVFQSSRFKDGLECSVCLCEVSDGEKARLLPNCNHGFHLDCIDMWFQSHSTCPLCRDVVAAPEVGPPPQESGGLPAHAPEMEPLNFPTNVLFWGNEGEVNTRVTRLEEGSSSSPSSPNGEENEAGNGANGGEEVEVKSPATRFRSLKRLLSRERRINVAPCDPPNGDIEQGLEGVGQC